MVLVLAATYESGVQFALDRSVPERFRYYGIPVAVSADRYGLPGYVAYVEVQKYFASQTPIDQILTQHLPAVLSEPTATEPDRGQGLFFVPADDKGDVTFARMAFAMFGLRVSALYQLYFVLVGLSIIALIVAFHADLLVLFVGLCGTLALWGLVPAFQDGLFLPNSVTLYDPRVFGAGAVLALLHLGFSATSGAPMSLVRWLCLGYQTWFVIFAIHVRFDNVWMLVALCAWVAAHAVWHRRGLTRTLGLRLAIPLLATIAGLAALLAWERVVYHPRYFTSHMAHHLVWHNMGIGFVLHPGFARTFAFPASDQAMLNRTARYLLERGDERTVVEVFGASYSNSNGTPAGATIATGEFLHSGDSDIARYDRYARDVVLAMIRDKPVDALALYLYYKPRYALAMMAWFLGVSTSKPALLENGEQTPLFRGHDPLPRAPVSARQVVVFTLGLLVLLSAGAVLPWSLLAGLIPLVLVSALPLMVAYAAPFLMAPSLMVTTLALFVVAGVVITGAAARLRTR